MDINQIPDEWEGLIHDLIKESDCTAYGVFNPLGEIIAANNSMLLFLNVDDKTKPRNRFINPNFDEIRDFNSSSNLVFEGVLTIGNSVDQNFALNAKIYRQNNTFLVFAEADVFHLFENNNKMSVLNQQVNNLQRQLIKEKKSLQKLTDQLIDHKNNLENIVENRTAELAKAKDKAEESDRFKSAFISNMSHEIRTPINSVIGFSDLLTGLISDPVLVKYLNSVQSNAKTLLSLITDILELSEIEAGNAQVNNETIDSQIFFSEIMALFETQLIESNLDHKLSIQPSFPKTIVIDADKIKQIIINLLNNAIKFTQEGFVSLNIEHSENKQLKGKLIELVISVEDSGIGIPKENLPKLFKPFSQLDDQSNRKYEGTGLGLALSKRLTSLMNGDIKVNSTVGQGTKITVTVPHVKITEAHHIKTPNLIHRDSIEFEPGHILLVDNTESDQEYIKELLVKTPVKLDFANNINTAIELVKRKKYDLVLSDIQIPPFNGLNQIKDLVDLLKEIKIPIIGLSEMRRKVDSNEAKSSGFNGLLIRPIGVDEFYNELIKYLNHSLINSSNKEDNTEIKEQKHLSVQEKEELLEILNGRLLLMWKEFESVQSMKKVRQFSIELEETTKKYPYNPLQSLAQKLRLSVNSFDVVEIKKNLKLYPQLVSNIKYTE